MNIVVACILILNVLQGIENVEFHPSVCILNYLKTFPNVSIKEILQPINVTLLTFILCIAIDKAFTTYTK